MPPVESAYQKREGRRGERRTDLLCRIKYTNTLPDIPFDPKFIQYPFDHNRFVHYNPTSLVNNNKWELLVEQDVGVPIDLVNPDKYTLLPDQTQLHPSDEKLLDDETSVLTNSNRAQLNARIVPWLRKTEYIGSNISQFGFKNEKAEAKANIVKKNRVIEDDFYFKKENRIKAIEDSFKAAKTPLTDHYSKPGVHKVEEWYVFPDEEMWGHPCAQVIFDDDPAPKEHSAAEQIKEMSQAMIRGMIDADGDQFVGYFLPTAETMQKRKNDEESGIDFDPVEEYEYKMIREYNWNVKNKSTRGYEENYFFVIRENGVFYNELETRVRLSKRRLKGFEVADSRIVVKHREFTEAELRKQKRRHRHLQNIAGDGEEEEEDEDEEEEEEEEDDVEAEQESANTRRKAQKTVYEDNSHVGSAGEDTDSEKEEEGNEDEEENGSQQMSNNNSDDDGDAEIRSSEADEDNLNSAEDTSQSKAEQESDNISSQNDALDVSDNDSKSDNDDNNKLNTFMPSFSQHF